MIMINTRDKASIQEFLRHHSRLSGTSRILTGDQRGEITWNFSHGLERCLFQEKEKSKGPVSRETFADDGVLHHVASGGCGKRTQNMSILNIVQCYLQISYIWHLKVVQRARSIMELKRWQWRRTITVLSWGLES